VPRGSPIEIHRFAAAPTTSAPELVQPGRPGQPARPLTPRPAVQPGGGSLTLTVPVTATCEVEHAYLLKIFAGDALLWESDELDGSRTTQTVPLQVQRGQTLQLRAYAMNRETRTAEATP
jgi:hypothetical protein